MTSRRVSSGRLGPALAALLLLGSCGGTSASGTTVEYQARDLRADTTVDLADLRGSVVLLSGWATTCAPCRKELPALNELYEARRSDGLVVVAVNLDPAGPSTREVLPIVDRMGLTMPTWIDTDNEFALVFGAVSMPTNVLVDRDGVVQHTWNGAINLDDEDTVEKIERLIVERLRAEPTEAVSGDIGHHSGSMEPRMLRDRLVWWNREEIRDEKAVHDGGVFDAGIAVDVVW